MGILLKIVRKVGSAPQQRQADGQDYVSVPAAVDRLLRDVLVRLQKLKPDVLVEFRQTYIGPLMRTYGNMFRAGDSPNDALTNRIRTLNIRQLCGHTAAHADMLMWHKDESIESAALQILNILFSVPQISLMLDGHAPIAPSGYGALLERKENDFYIALNAKKKMFTRSTPLCYTIAVPHITNIQPLLTRLPPTSNKLLYQVNMHLTAKLTAKGLNMLVLARGNGQEQDITSVTSCLTEKDHQRCG